MKKLTVFLLTLGMYCSVAAMVYAGLNDGLIAYYPLDGNAEDHSLMGNDGIEHNGVLYEQGVSGQAARFDGHDDFIRISNFSTTLNEFTVSLWVKSEDISLPRKGFAIHSGEPGYKAKGDKNITIRPYGEPNGDFTRGVLATSNGSNGQVVDGPGIEENKWHHILFLRRISNVSNQLEIYVDGVCEDTEPCTLPEFIIANGFIHIGAGNFYGGGTGWDTGNSYKWKGSIDEIRIYNRALNIDEILSLYSGNVDSDGDGITDDIDNCPFIANTEQDNHDGDTQGDVCDLDDDNDGILDENDACPFEDSTGQDANGEGCIDTLSELPLVIEEMDLPHGTEKSLTTIITNSEASIGRNNLEAAINQLEAFINKLQAQRGKKIAVDDADMLIEYANNIISLLARKILFAKYKGIAMIDPIIGTNSCGDESPDFSKQHFTDLVNDLKDISLNWHANIVRVPITPTDWLQAQGDVNGAIWYDAMFAVLFKEAYHLDLAVIIDWHGFGNLENDQIGKSSCATDDRVFDDYNKPSLSDTIQFWEYMTNLIKQLSENNEHLPKTILYEIFNEPSDDIQWSQWANFARQIIACIRGTDPNRTILVGGIDYGYDLSQVSTNPIGDRNIAYVSHPYPKELYTNYQRIGAWDTIFGEVASDSRFTVMVTEWGFNPDPSAPTYQIGSVEGYGNDLIEYMDSHNIGWTAWSYSEDWTPALLRTCDQWPGSCSYGDFVYQMLYEGWVNK